MQPALLPSIDRKYRAFPDFLSFLRLALSRQAGRQAASSLLSPTPQPLLYTMSRDRLAQIRVRTPLPRLPYYYCALMHVLSILMLCRHTPARNQQHPAFATL